MDIKKEYEKFFERKKNDICVHDAEDVITFAKHYHALQFQQTGVSTQSEQLKCQCKKAKFTRMVDTDFNLLCGRFWKTL